MSKTQEKEDIESNKKVIRIGGMHDDWTKADVEEDEYMPETTIWKLKLTKAVPFVDLGDPCYISIKGKQAAVHYENEACLTKERKRTQERDTSGNKTNVHPSTYSGTRDLG